MFCDAVRITSTLMNESSGGPFFLTSFCQADTFQLRYRILSQEAGNPMVTFLEQRVYMGGGEYLLSEYSPTRLLLD
ncbi:hypothetical protein EVAR_13251_1 [Eumeta japonica]|uniref:Uncharacterized protein n=1 Tax=Eumeta variegata TaxID=151549 RepID=A0A4C1TS87_EUMVA|nr:hypothetical protein EVAR_13251_1 [Eumeta japonica]